MLSDVLDDLIQWRDSSAACDHKKVGVLLFPYFFAAINQ